MAASELSTVFRDLPYRIQTASLKERREIFESITNVLDNPGITEGVIKAICKLFHFTLHQYVDNFSQHLLRKLVEGLAKHHPEWTVKHLNGVLLEIAKQQQNIVVTRNVSQTCLHVFNWTCLLFSLGWKSTAKDMLVQDLPKLVQTQCILYTLILSVKYGKTAAKANYLFLESMEVSKECCQLYLDNLKTLEMSQHIVVFSSVLNKCADEELFNKYTDYLLEVFIKTIVTSKKKPLPCVVDCCDFLSHVTVDQWKASLMPAVLKAMLRSPEVILECVGIILSRLSIPLCPYAADLGKSIINQLNSKDPLTRLEATTVSRQLATKLSTPAAIDTLLHLTFGLLNGSEGKITLAEHKQSVLRGAGNLSYNQSGAGVKTALGYLARVLETETHEKTLCCAVEMAALWWGSGGGGEEAVDWVVDTFKSTITKKTWSPLIRTTFLQHLSSTSPLLTPAHTATLTPILVSLLESAVATATSQPPQFTVSVTEALAAARILLELTNNKVAGNEVSKKALETGILWSFLLDAVEKSPQSSYLGEKYLTSSEEFGLELVTTICTHLLLTNPHKLTPSLTKHLQRGIIHCLAVTPSSHTRRHTLSLVRKQILPATPATIQVTRGILRQLDEYLDTVSHNNAGNSSNSGNNAGGAGNNVGSAGNNAGNNTGSGGSYGNNSGEYNYAHTLVECVRSLTISGELLVDVLGIAHHPLVVELDGGKGEGGGKLWVKVAGYLQCDPTKLITESLLHSLFSPTAPLSPTSLNTYATLCHLLPSRILPSLVRQCRETFHPDTATGALLAAVSTNDYFTYLTPPGELYDKGVVPAQGDLDEGGGNMKRESKAYSYREQLEEMELRRELAEKRRREGKVVKVVYTVKQQEAIRVQLEKEGRVRERLALLNSQVVHCSLLLTAASRGNPHHLSRHLNSLIPTLLSGLTSPLAAPHLVTLHRLLGQMAFAESSVSVVSPSLAETICYVTLRQYKPACDLPQCWQEEGLDGAVERVVAGLHHICTSRPDGDLAVYEPQANHITAAAFAYAFPLLNKGLQSKSATESLVHDGLQIISEQSKLRTTVLNNLFHPVHLPLQEMLSLLIQLIGKNTGRIQIQACACLLDVARAAAAATSSTADLTVLLDGLQSASVMVRDASLRALVILQPAFPQTGGENGTTDNHNDDSPTPYQTLTRRIWIARFDPNVENRTLARSLWTDASLIFPVDECSLLLVDVEHPVDGVQQAAAEALAALLEEAQRGELVEGVLERLVGVYRERLVLIPAKFDEFGHQISKPLDVWKPRRGVAIALGQLAPLLHRDVAGTLVEFFVNTALADREESVRKAMLQVALQVVNIHGKDTVATLLPVFENFLDRSKKSANFDAVKQAVVILMGSLAQHLDKEDPRIEPIVERLITALSTPSQQVQEAVAKCLPPLVPCVKDKAAGYVNKMLHQLLKSDNYGHRKGAAYGLAGLVKGMSILALKQLDIMTKLTEAIQNQKNFKQREGALLALEMLFQMLGKLFEPYIVHMLPNLLNCFGDTNKYVRVAAEDTARVVMSKLSAHGVKLILPSLLKGLDDDNWRTKVGSVELLGAMAYCAPKQLGSCLPTVVPKLIGVLSDSHLKVQEAAGDALKVIGSVIKNPEIQAIVPVLLAALQDPSKPTHTCLQTLLDTEFVHFIDAPSLALIMPVVQRAFLERNTETRKMAAQIIGNMYSLTDQIDLHPYLPTIIPGLKSSLLDPVPEVRSASARALGAMVRGMGEVSFDELLPWLMQTLTSESSSVDRSGAAQGLSEVVGGLGKEKLHKLMPDVIDTAKRSDIAPHVKDGYIMMFIYMPNAFPDEFMPYIGQIIKPILSALADETEYVRETALKAGQRIVTLYADSAIQLLLPELERGLFDENWRIRLSSVQLLGDLLYRVSGVTGKMSTETASEDDNFGTEQSHEAIIGALGEQRRNRVLSGLYMGRSDSSLMVRQSALHVWKVVVTNTPRTLREILPTLFELLLGCLASDSPDKRKVAARTLGDLVRKLGERVLPDIIPILERGLQSKDPDQRQGVCVGLSEIMSSTGKELIVAYALNLVPTVRTALCDPLVEVRRAAAMTFDSLHSTIGVRALDDILPLMLAQLTATPEDPLQAEYTLDGLQQVMAVKPRVVLPYLIPQLTTPPANTKALAILAGVAGEALNRHLPKILPALYASIAIARGTPEESQQLEYCRQVVLAVTDEAGVRVVVEALLDCGCGRSADSKSRHAAAVLLSAFCSNPRVTYEDHVSSLYRGLVELCATDEDPEVLRMVAEALFAVTNSLDNVQKGLHVSDLRHAIKSAKALVRRKEGNESVLLLPGFCQPKGVTAVMPIFRETLLIGDGDEKESAAQGMTELILVSSPEAMAPNATTTTGPLIRILGERFSDSVKIAVLDALATLLVKIPASLKSFLPQLQMTLLKALGDGCRAVRLHAGTGLGRMLVIHVRPDTVYKNLLTTITTDKTDSAIRDTTLHALRGILNTSATERCSPAQLADIHTALLPLIGSSEDVTRATAAGCLGALLKWLPAEKIESTLMEHLLAGGGADGDTQHGRCVALMVGLKESATAIWTARYQDRIRTILLSQLTSDTLSHTLTSIRSCGYLLRHLMNSALPVPADLLPPFARTMNHTSNEVKLVTARVCSLLAHQVIQQPDGERWTAEVLRAVLPMLVNGTKEKNGYVKANSEIALAAVLQLHRDNVAHDLNPHYQRCLRILDSGARGALCDVVDRVLSKMSTGAGGGGSGGGGGGGGGGTDEELDDTLLT